MKKRRTGMVVLRIGLGIGLATWLGYGIVHGIRDTGELYSLKTSGRQVNAQVIGQEPMPADARMGYIHYAFNDGTKSIDSRFPVPVAAYAQFWIGRQIPVTFLPSSPHTLRIGDVNSGKVARSAIVELIFMIAGLIAFGLPLIALTAMLKMEG